MKETDKNRITAFEVLVKYGFFIPFDQVEHYHGRANPTLEEWEVDPHFDNSGNNTGNHNIQAVSALSTAEYGIAKDFAMARTMRSGGRPEVYKIVSSDSHAMMFNFRFSMDKLDSNARKEVQSALRVLTSYTINQLDPAKFEDRQDYQNVMNSFKVYFNHKIPSRVISYDTINEIKSVYASNYKNEVNEELFVQIAGALNARYLIWNYPNLLMNKFCNEKDVQKRQNVDVKLHDGKTTLAPVNMHYASSWLDVNHVIGARMGVESATLMRELDANFIFDKTKIATEKQQGDKLQSIINEYGDFARLIGNVSGMKGVDDFLRRADCEGTMNWIKKTPFFANLYEKDAKVWERFTVGEHTETTLRVFENTFEENVPPALVPFMKILLMSHDLGKGIAKDRAEIKTRTAQVSRTFFNALSMPPAIQELMLFIINESQDYTTDFYVNKNVVAEYQLKKLCERKLRELFGQSSESLVDGLVGVCKMLQTCDSGAYTRYAVTRDTDTGVYYWNVNNRFTKGFKTPADMKGMQAEFYEPDEMGPF